MIRAVSGPCPACGERLVPRLVHDVHLDVCSRCGAHWFDGGELEELAHRTERDDLPVAASFQERGEPKPCPRCTTADLHPGVTAHHEIWRCSRCRGVLVPWRGINGEPEAPAEPLHPAIGGGLVVAEFLLEILALFV